VGEEEHRTKKVVRCVEGKGDIQASQTRISEGGYVIEFNCATRQGSTRIQHASIIGSYQRDATHGTSKYNQRFFQSCVNVLGDPSSMKILQNILEKCNIETEEKIDPKRINHLHTRRRTSREFRLNANIGDFNMGNIILDLGLEVNVLPKKTWKCMGETTLRYSHVQFKLANQHRVLPIGRLRGVIVDLDGVRTKEDFEVIKIVDNKTPYPTLLGLDWAFDNQAIINLKTRKMTFEFGEVITPLDPSKGEMFVEPTCLD
jgi:hypothetical protein